MRQKTERKITLQAGTTGEARSAGVGGTEALAANTEVESRAAVGPSMEAIVERDNLRKALAQVKRNKGAAGVDGMSLDALAPYLKEHWPAIRARLLDGTYQPQPVRRVEIPKATGGTRPLGIPHAAVKLHSSPTNLWGRLKLFTRFIPCAASGSTF
jgi:RNA-directed DNA polymerase